MPIALSWSRLSDYQQCARKFFLKYVQKSFPQEDMSKSVHLVKGSNQHKQLEDYLMARKGMKEMPPGFDGAVTQTLPLLDGLLTAFKEAYPEAQVAAKVDWTPEEWFGPEAAWRAIWDATFLNPKEALIVDWKSGKVYEYGATYGQLHLSAVIALNRFPHLDYVDVMYAYIEHKKTEKFRVHRDQLPQVQKHFESEYDKVQVETQWQPEPNEFCKWCPATQKQCPMSRKL